MAWGFYQAQLTVSDSSGHNYGTVAAGVNHDKIFTLTHSGGDVSATALNVLNFSGPFNYKGGTFPGTGGSCSRTLTRETGSCTIVVSLSSASSGIWSNTISFTYLNGTNTITINRDLSAITRQRAQITFAPSLTHNFGPVVLNGSGSQSFTVTYVSGELAASNLGFSTLSGFFNYTGGTYPGSGGTCGATLSSGSCTITLSYSPTSYGIHSLNTNFTYNDAATTQSLALSLQGRTSSILTNGSGAFGNVVNGQTKDISINLSATAGNGITGLSPTSISSPYTFKGGSFPGTGGTCTSTLNASTSCSIVLTFAPTTEGVRNGTLVLSFNGGTGPLTHTVSLTGNATPAANITIASTNFGSTSVNSFKEMAVIVTNSSTISPVSPTWSLPAGFSFKNGSFAASGSNCWSTSCTINLVFNPTVATTYSGTLTLTYNDGTGNLKNATATLTGTGFLTDDLFLSRFDTVSFSSIYVGATNDQSFTLAHGGGTTPAVISSKAPANATDYVVMNDTCPASLNNGASCTFTLRFAPQTSGAKPTSLNVNYNNGVAKTVSRLVTGTAVAPALLTPSPTTLAFGSRATDATYDLTLQIFHSGSPNASSFTRTVSGVGFTKVADSCTTSLGSSNNCSVTIRFTPTAATSYSGNLALIYSNGFTSVTTNVALSGTGAPTAVLTYTAATYDFGDIIQTQSSTRTITINHTGPIAASSMSANTLSAPYTFKGGTYPGTGGTCGDSLNSGSCTLVIDFAPTTTGIKNQTLTMSYDNGTTTRTINALLTGESLAQAIISISETNPYHFGTTNLSGTIDKAFTLINGGSVTGTAIGGSFNLSVFTFKGGSYPGIGGTCTTSLDAGAACTVVLSFNPTSAVTFNGSLTLNYNDGLRVQSELKNLSGTGSNTLQFQNYLNYFSSVPTIKKQKVFVEDSSHWATIDAYQLVLFSKFGERKFWEPNHLFPLMEGLIIRKIKHDINQDGHLDLLFSIHDEEARLIGYSIRCGRTGRILERYLSPAETL